MSRKADRPRLEFVQQLLSDIEQICSRHVNARQAMQDVEGRPALLMCLMQLGETLWRIESPDLRDRLPVHSAYTMRNVISHNYLGVNTEIIVQTIEADLPALRFTVAELLHSMHDSQ